MYQGPVPMFPTSYESAIVTEAKKPLVVFTFITFVCFVGFALCLVALINHFNFRYGLHKCPCQYVGEIQYEDVVSEWFGKPHTIMKMLIQYESQIIQQKTLLKLVEVNPLDIPTVTEVQSPLVKEVLGLSNLFVRTCFVDPKTDSVFLQYHQPWAVIIAVILWGAALFIMGAYTMHVVKNIVSRNKALSRD